MIEYSIEQNKETIRAVSERMGEDPCMMLAIAHIETGGKFNNLAKSKSGTYVGLFQLSDGYSGIRGDERYNPWLATEAAIRGVWRNRQTVERELGEFEPWYAYMAHQQGATGFTTLMKTRSLPIKQSKYYSNMMNNIPTKYKDSLSTVGDFLRYWQKRFNELYYDCGGLQIAAYGKKFLPVAIAGGILIGIWWFFIERKK